MNPNFRNRAAWKFAKRLAIDPLKRALVHVNGRGKIPLMWCSSRNWGDALSPVLVSLLSGKRAMHVTGLHHNRFLAIGSILGSANERAEVWGSGFIRENEELMGLPKKVHAVRGPLTRDALLKLGIDCPEVYGDPALLLPRFFNPTVDKQYTVGIIPHYIDKNHSWLDQHRSDPRVQILDIENGIQDFVVAVKSCEVILSSSLHGLICADAYGIPNTWVRFSDNVMGGDFKFRDYRISIGADEPNCLQIKDGTPLNDAIDLAKNYELQINLRALLMACPFLSEPIRNEVGKTTPNTNGLPDAFHSANFGEQPQSLIYSCLNRELER